MCCGIFSPRTVSLLHLYNAVHKLKMLSLVQQTLKIEFKDFIFDFDIYFKNRSRSQNIKQDMTKLGQNTITFTIKQFCFYT